jgi:chromate transporter
MSLISILSSWDFFFFGAQDKTLTGNESSGFCRFCFYFSGYFLIVLLKRHIPFLKAVSFYALTAFGGPQGHIGMMTRTFVQRRKDVSEEELLEYNAFCQMLPGPSSTQTVMLIAMKRGGISLAILTLLIWVLPAAFIMGAFSFLFYYIDLKDIQTNLFLFIKSMSVGFVFYAASLMMNKSVKHLATWGIMLGALIITLLVHSPWVFPLVLILAGMVSNFSNRRIPEHVEKPQKISWVNLWLFAAVFIVAGILSETARIHHWEMRRIFNLFENFYRFGSFVFGGGQTLLPMMLYQFVDMPKAHGATQLLSSADLLAGYGLVQAVPGPVFSICSFVGGMVMSPYGWGWQFLGCLVATIAVFTPSTMMLFFLYPIYQNLRQHVIIFRALEGFNAAVVGFIWASGIVLFQALNVNPLIFDWLNLSVAIVTFCILRFSKIPAPFVVLGWLIIGLMMNVTRL